MRFWVHCGIEDVINVDREDLEKRFLADSGDCIGLTSVLPINVSTVWSVAVQALVP